MSEREDGARVGVRQREDGVLELDEADEAAGVDGGRAQCGVGWSINSRSPWSSAGAMASKSSAQAFGLPGRFTISADPAMQEPLALLRLAIGRQCTARG